MVPVMFCAGPSWMLQIAFETGALIAGLTIWLLPDMCIGPTLSTASFCTINGIVLFLVLHIHTKTGSIKGVQLFLCLCFAILDTYALAQYPTFEELLSL